MAWMNLIFLLIFWAPQFQLTDAQNSKAQTYCPKITVTCSDTVDQHESMVCSASASGQSDSNIKFRWKVSQGTITKGQETETIEVETKGLFPGTIEATVEVLGAWPYSCPRQAAASSILVISDRGPELFDKFGDIPLEEENEHLHRLALRLGEEPGSQPYIIVYAGRQAYQKEAEERGARAKKYLIENYGIENKRVVVMDGGYRETRSIELWIEPLGSISSPVASPTVDVKDVKVMKGKRPNKD